jgi:signal-transduction protein with cAMP-binding, CBS, and nucleotidyltransferase domain
MKLEQELKDAFEVLADKLLELQIARENYEQAQIRVRQINACIALQKGPAVGNDVQV